MFLKDYAYILSKIWPLSLPNSNLHVGYISFSMSNSKRSFQICLCFSYSIALICRICFRAESHISIILFSK